MLGIAGMECSLCCNGYRMILKGLQAQLTSDMRGASHPRHLHLLQQLVPLLCCCACLCGTYSAH